MKHILIIHSISSDLEFIENILEPHYKISTLSSIEKAIDHVSENTPGLILLDLDLFGMEGYNFVKTLKNRYSLDDIPVIFMTSGKYQDIELKILELEDTDFISKPVYPQILLKRVQLQLELNQYRKNIDGLVYDKTSSIEALQSVVIRCTTELVECRDRQTGGHVKRTATYVKILCEEILRLGLYKDYINKRVAKDIIKSAPLHDLGKIGITDNVLLKNGKLDDEELEYMRTHCELGYKAIQKMIDEVDSENFLHIARDMAYYHHEKWDGTGYPCGLSGEEIPIPARIMAIADVYDALITERPYKKKFTHEEAVDIMLNQDSKIFDPLIVNVFKGISDKFKEVSFK